MKSLSDLLLTYHVPGVKTAEIRRICGEEITLLIGCSLSPKQIQYKNEKLVISVPPVMKSAILVRKGEIIERIKARNIEIYGII